MQTGKVRFGFRHFPFIGDESLWAAEASECAGEQEQFWGYYDKLFLEQAGENVGAYNLDNLKQFASDLNLDSEAFNACLDLRKYQQKVENELEQGVSLGVRGTPTLFVNGTLIEGGSDYGILRQSIEDALADG